MTIETVIRVNTNLNWKYYLIKENGEWRLFDKNKQLNSLSNITSNAMELYIALDTAKTKKAIIGAIKKYADYVSEIEG